MTELLEAVTEEDVAAVRRLFLEYWETPGVAACTTGFQQEADRLPQGYLFLLLARVEGQPAGCAAVRELEGKICEMKRLYVRPEARGLQLGRLLVEGAMDRVARQGYQTVRLDTLPSMKAAIRLYQALGFRPIERYSDVAAPDALFFERSLRAQGGDAPVRRST